MTVETIQEYRARGGKIQKLETYIPRSKTRMTFGDKKALARKLVGEGKYDKALNLMK
jgi:hypothetical protein